MSLLPHQCANCGRRHRDVWPMHCGPVENGYTLWYCEDALDCLGRAPGKIPPALQPDTRWGGTYAALRRNQGTATRERSGRG